MPRQPSVTNLGHRESRLPWRSGQRRERSVGGRITVAAQLCPPGSALGRSFSGRAKGLAVHPSGSSESFTIRRWGGASRRPAARKNNSPDARRHLHRFSPGWKAHAPSGTRTSARGTLTRLPRSAIQEMAPSPAHCGRGRTQLAVWVGECCEPVISVSIRRLAIAGR